VARQRITLSRRRKQSEAEEGGAVNKTTPMGSCASAPVVRHNLQQKTHTNWRSPTGGGADHHQGAAAGAGECGKSTFLKQLKVVNSVPFKSEEIKMYKDLAYRYRHASGTIRMHITRRTFCIPGFTPCCHGLLACALANMTLVRVQEHHGVNTDLMSSLY
jgi:hypothetical protein